MRTMKRSLLRAGLAGLLGVSVGAVLPQLVQAQVVGSDRPAGIVVYPKVVVNSALGVDTVIELANTNQVDPVAVHCFYVNALGTCSTTGESCLVNFDCPLVFDGEVCNGDWRTTDFRVRITREQALGWTASGGQQFLPCDPGNPDPLAPAACEGGQTNANLSGPGASIPSADDPFLGELKCVQIDDSTSQPVAANDLIGRATLYADDPFLLVGSGRIRGLYGTDVATYSAIGIQAADTNDGDDVLCLGLNASGDCTTAEYASCPMSLILNHFFEDASLDNGDTVRTSLTLVPCTEFQSPRPDRGLPDVFPTTAQFLVFNEFEQRFSASTGVTCYSELLLADIDTRPSYRPDDSTSIFSVGVQGTLTGQTRIRALPGAETDLGHGLLGLAREIHAAPGRIIAPIRSGAANLQFVGLRAQADIVRLQPTSP